MVTVLHWICVNMKFYSALLIVFTLYSLPASASNFYAGLQHGIMNHSGDMTIIDDTINSSVGLNREQDYQVPEDSSATASLFLGYKLSRDLSIEIVKGGASKVTGSLRAHVPETTNNLAEESLEANFTSISFVGIWPVKGNWALSTRLGFSSWGVEYEQRVVDGDITDITDPAYEIQTQKLTDTAAGMLLGVGITYGFNANVEFRFLVEQHFVDFGFNNIDLDYEALSLTAGAAYHF